MKSEQKESTPTPVNHSHNLLTAFKKRYGADSHLVMLGYFGSYARNRATAESDVDR